MGHSLSVCFGRTLIINDIKSCNNPGKNCLEPCISDCPYSAGKNCYIYPIHFTVEKHLR